MCKQKARGDFIVISEKDYNFKDFYGARSSLVIISCNRSNQ